MSPCTSRNSSPVCHESVLAELTSRPSSTVISAPAAAKIGPAVRHQPPGTRPGVPGAKGTTRAEPSDARSDGWPRIQPAHQQLADPRPPACCDSHRAWTALSQAVRFRPWMSMPACCRRRFTCATPRARADDARSTIWRTTKEALRSHSIDGWRGPAACQLAVALRHIKPAGAPELPSTGIS